jgi:hypothetical protein
MALVNEANGVGNSPSAAPLGFANPTLYSLASSFHDIADNSNNNWFDNGQTSEVGTVPTVGQPPPAVAMPYSMTTQLGPSGFDVPVSNGLLFGAAKAGASEAPGLYHAVTGYDLATGLGTPTCPLFASLAPNFTPSGGGSPPPPAGVTFTYHQVGECEAFPGDPTLTAGTGFAWVVFGIDSIDNAGASTFDFDPDNLFVPLNNFVFLAEDVPPSCVETPPCPVALFPTPFAAPETVTSMEDLLLTGGATNTQFVMAEIAVSNANGSSAPPVTEEPFFLSYSLAAGVSPAGGGSLAPNVTLVKSNPTGAVNPTVVNDCGQLTLK